MVGITENRDLFLGDYDTPEQQVGSFQTDWPWESCITICKQWAWKPDDELKSLEQCIHTLVNTAGGGGNLLLNVGPMPNGQIEARQVGRLKEIGDWLERYGHTIYGTRGGPFKPDDWGASTHWENKIYLHVLNAPDETLVLPPLAQKIISSHSLSGGTVSVEQDDQGIEIYLSHVSSKRSMDTIIVLELDGPVGNS